MVCTSFARFGSAAGTAQQSCRIPGVYPRFRDGLGDDGTGTDHNPITNRDREYGRVCANAHVIAQPGPSPKIASTLRRAPYGKQVIDEHRAVRNETVVPDSDQFT